VNELALFAGAGGGILGGHLLGWRTVCAVEWEPYAACVLAARQNDGILPPFPIWDDIQTFDGRPWRGIVDVVSGGFPCQDISAAGKGAGIDGERSGMWREMARIICEVRPQYVFVENSPMLTIRGGTRVVGDLTALGYDCRWTVMGASEVGAPHQRDRFWLVGHSNRMRESQPQGSQQDKRGWVGNSSSEMAYATSIGQPTKSNASKHRKAFDAGQANQPRSQSKMDNADSTQRQGGRFSCGTFEEHADACGASWWVIEPNVGRVADGVAARVDRLKAIGNGQVPAVAATAWKLLSET
jgi:DNA (cytosine-5)-methyltransferase 1